MMMRRPEGGFSWDQVRSSSRSSATAPQRRSFYQQRGPERRLPDAPYYADGVIRSASLQHSPAAHLLGYGTSGGGGGLDIGQRYHHVINRSHSSGVVDSASIRQQHHHLKKTVRFDAEDEEDEDDGAWMTSSSKDSAGWDWLLSATPSGTSSSAVLSGTTGRQESRESAARDSGVETLTSGEGELTTAYDTLKSNHSKVSSSPRPIVRGGRGQGRQRRRQGRHVLV